MPVFTQLVKDAILEHWFRGSNYADSTAGGNSGSSSNSLVLLKAAPGNAGTLDGTTLISGVNPEPADLGVAQSDSAMALQAAVVFETSGGNNAEAVSHVGVQDNQGNLLSYSQLNSGSTEAVDLAIDFEVPAGGVALGYDVNAVSGGNNDLRAFPNTIAQESMQLIFEYATTTATAVPSTLFVSLHTAKSYDSAINEFTNANSGNYTRQAVTFSAPEASDIAGASASARMVKSSGAVNFSSVGTNGDTQNQTLAQWGIWDAASGGNLIAYGVLPGAGESVPDGADINFATGAIKVHLD